MTRIKRVMILLFAVTIFCWAAVGQTQTRTSPQTPVTDSPMPSAAQAQALQCAADPTQLGCEATISQLPLSGLSGLQAAQGISDPYSGVDEYQDLMPGAGTQSPTSYPNVPGQQAGAMGARQASAQERYEPEPPTQFQLEVRASAGQLLSIFGQSLFTKVPSTFAPADRVNVSDNYAIGPGDELRIRIWGPVDIQTRAVVDRSGDLYIPRVGSVPVTGVRYKDLESHLRTAVARTLRGFELAATISRVRGIQIFVAGYARRPGSYTVSGLSTLVNALFASGGPAPTGSMRNIQLKREGKVVTQFDLYDLLLRGDTSKDVVLQPDDVIYIGAVGPMAAITGAVNVPAIYELAPNTTLSQEIDLAGGLSTTADVQRAVIERVEDRKERSILQVPLDSEGYATSLRDGDIIRIFSLSPRIENVVILRGNVAVPGRFPHKPGMRVSDLIPNREFLLTNEYWTGHLDTSPAKDGKLLKPTIAPDINWDYAVVQRIDRVDLTAQLFSFNLGRAIEKTAGDDLELRPGDIVTVFSQKDLAVPLNRRTKYVRLEGEFSSAGVYRALPGETLRQLVQRVGLTSNAYLFGAELTRESTRIEQQKRLDQFAEELSSSIERQASSTRGLSAEDVALANARAQAQREFVTRLRSLRATGRIVLELRPDASDVSALPDIPLEDGDVFLMRSRPNTVNLLGEVYNPTAFVYKPAQSVGEYVKRGGGTTRNADRSRTYVVRANGDVVSLKEQSSLWRGDPFNRILVLPGDTIVVPLRLNRGETARAIRDWSQIVAQFALGVAAINTLTQ